MAANGIGILTTVYTLPMRLIQSRFVDTDPGAYSVVFCKITWFVQYSIRYVDQSEILVDKMFIYIFFIEDWPFG
jgi:hypothetical protein